jgi:uncharacterized surface protein with fasciclin (FAS1) repeats
MKKILLLIVALLYSSVMFAQKGGTTDTAKTIGPLKITAGDSMLPANDIVQNISLSKNLSVFYNFIIIANLTETYQSKGPITVFAPINSAFDSLPVSKVDSLSKPDHLWELTGILTYHAIAGKVSAKDIEKQINNHNGLATFTTLGGSKFTAKIDSNRNIVLLDENGDQSIISRFDIEQRNGMLHIVNKVLIPKTKVI